MFQDDFKSNYKSIPFSTFSRDHEKNTIAENIVSLPHNHKEMELLSVLDGKATMYIDSNNYEIKKGDIIIISPYMLHNSVIYTTENFRHFCLCFDLEIIPDKDLKNNLEKMLVKTEPIVTSENPLSKLLSKYIENAYNSHLNQKDGWELGVIGNLSLFFSCLTEHGLINKAKSIKGNGEICYKTIEYIENNYTKDITSTDAAKDFYVSNSYFCRIFKKNFGICFQNYVSIYRLEKAKRLLKTTDLSITDISMQVGFNSPSFFSKLFKEYLIMTPTEYRKSNE